MNRDELLEFHEKMNADCVEIMQRKNSDYTGGDGDTPFKNFELVERLGITDVPTAMLVRMSDKMSRIITFVQGGEYKVKDESFRDTVVDLRNYLVLLAAYLTDENPRSTITKSLPPDTD